MNKNGFQAIVVFFLLNMSCAVREKLSVESDRRVYLSDSGFVTPLPPEQLGTVVERLQEIHGQYGDKKYVMQAYLLLDREKISVSAFTPTGNRIYDLMYTGGSISLDAVAGFPERSAVYMVVDIQLCYYPEQIVNKMLQETGLVMETVQVENGWVRRIFDQGDLIIEIRRSGLKLEYKNYLRRYEVSIAEIML